MAVNEFVETAMQGKVVSSVLDGQWTYDLVVRLDDSYREDVETLRRMATDTPGGGAVKLEDVTSVYMVGGPIAVNREQVRRRIVVQCSVSGRGLVDVEEIKGKLASVKRGLPSGYSVQYESQLESEQSGLKTISALFVASLVGIFLALFTMFRSVNLSLQVMAALPMALIGAIAALVIKQQTLTVAAMVGFIALVGVGLRNGILLLNHTFTL